MKNDERPMPSSYQHDRQVAFYTGQERQEDNSLRQRRQEERSIVSHDLSVGSNARAIEQWQEQQHERERQHAFQERAEDRALRQWQEQKQERNRQHAFQERAEDRALRQWDEQRQERERQHALQARGEERADINLALSLRADQRANQQMWEQQQERERQHAFQDRQEDRQIEGHGWHRESHTLQMRREEERLENERRARELAAARFTDPRASGVMGNARFGTLEDAEFFSLRNETGLFLGTLDGEGLHYDGAAHLLTQAPTRGGKGVHIILQNLAHIDGYEDKRSIVVVDVKNGENAYSSAQHRMRNIGDRIVTLNPCGLVGAPPTRLNPLDRVVFAPKDRIFDCATSIAHVLVPQKANNKDEWVTNGARQILQAVIAHYAINDPARCTLGNLWKFVVRDDKEIRADFNKMEKGEHPEISGYAGLFKSWMAAPAQWAAYMSEMTTAVESFSPSSPYTKATDASDWDARNLTKSPHTVYLMMEAEHLASKGRWVSLMINNLIETAADNVGPYRPLFLLDEFTQLPPIPSVMKALNLYAGLGIQLWFFAQDRKSIASLYGDDGAARIEAQSAVMQTWGIRDTSLMRDLEYWSGKTSVNIIGANMSDGSQTGTGINLTEQARPLLQVEDMRNLGEREQLIFLQRGPVFKAKLQPWYTTEDHAEVLADTRDVLRGGKLPPAEDRTIWKFPRHIPDDLHPPVPEYCQVVREEPSAAPQGEAKP